ncbi:MAG TPA: exodeoxyribonuclease VII small subunit [Campylobacterales bacterium]|nr:exodeoxyribonuclease VII small subunit [Campylobacterales bacterium]
MSEMSFEERIEKSKEILEKLMNSENTLSDSVALYKNGTDELKKASKLLEEAKLKFEVYQNDGTKE